MSNLDDALVKVKSVEAFMRRRYLYNHPIFADITAVVELLEAEVAAQPLPEPPVEPQETVAELKAEAEEAAAVEEAVEDATVEPEPPAERARKRG